MKKNHLKKLVKVLSSSTLALTVFLGSSIPVNSKMQLQWDNNVTSTMIENSRGSTYYFEQQDPMSLKNQLEEELNRDLKDQRNASGYYELDYHGTGYPSTGMTKIPAQPSGGVYFSNGGQIYYKDGSSVSIPVSISIGGKVFGASIGIGGYSSNPTNYAINIPAGAYYHGYVNKTFTLTTYKKYFVNPATGQRVFQGYHQSQSLNSIRFDVKRA